MRDTITNFLKMDVQTSIGLVYAGLAVVWLIVLFAAICSIVTRPMGTVAKVAWIVLVVGLPLVGMTLYCLYSLVRADYTFLQQFGLFPSPKPAQRPPKPVPAGSHPSHRHTSPT